MGGETLKALQRDPGLEPVAGVGRRALEGERLALPDGSGAIPYGTDLPAVLEQVASDVVADFTNASACIEAAHAATSRGLSFVTGSSGLSVENLETLGALAREHEVGVIVGPSFALGAVVLNHLARVAAPFFEYVDVFEAHHEAKIDAPSGTAIALARAISEGQAFTRPDPEREPVPGTRGGQLNGVSIHSTRMPGRLANHEVVLGTTGQTLSLKHDTLSRECFMPGVIMAIKEVTKQRKFIVGLESLLGLK